MGFKCGIVGLPNVGKSTLFNALTSAGVGAENFPFCTIEPNAGVVPMPDSRLDALADIVKPKRVVPTTMEFVDIAGLVAGASRGEGLGNQFLANIRETDAIAHVVRCFEDENVAHVSTRIDPAGDIEVINTELALADIESIERAIEKVNRVAKSGDKDAVASKNLLESIVTHLDAGKPVRSMRLTDLQIQEIRDLFLLTLKPVLYIANVDENGLTDNPLVDAVRTIAEEEGSEVVVICNKLEAEIAELEDAEKQEFLQDLGMAEAGLDRVIRAGYKLLGLQTYFTASPKEVRAWTLQVNATAPKAASVIHTDFERGFIRAEVISYTDYIDHAGEQGAKDAGKWRREGKEYRVQDGDVIHFLFNV